MRRSIRMVAGGAAREPRHVSRPIVVCGERDAVRPLREVRRLMQTVGEPSPGMREGGERRPLSAALLVCVTCKSEEGEVGAALYEALKPRFASENIELKAIACLSVCKRPCTVALAAPGKWTYVVGDLDRREHLDDVVTAARRYAAAPDGLVPWRDRPLPFRKGVVSRTPPLAFAALE